MYRTSVFLTLLLGSALPLGLAGQVPADLTRAIQARDQAIEAEDSLTWERFTAPDLVVVDDAGRVLSGAGHFAALRTSRQSSLTNQPILYIDGVRLNAGCVRESLDTRANGTVATRRCLKDGTWWLEVWEKAATGWQVVAVQGTAAAR